jgi:two-component system heavy metal sensor histidine kinase CusS
VENPGCGIAADLQPKIFERFVKGDSTGQSDDAVNCAGLGLAIVRSIMNLHGGTAEVRSSANGPTVFSLHFPPRPRPS